MKSFISAIDVIKEITKEEGCPWEELEFDFEADGEGERDIIDGAP